MLLGTILFISSCGIFKTHHKNKLIDFENNSIPKSTLKHNGYYYAELERKAYGSEIADGENIKYLSVFFINEDGFVILVNGVDSLKNYFCASNKNSENTYESAHKAIELMLISQNSVEKRTRRICDFEPNDIGNKGLVKIEKDKIKIQFYKIEMQKPGRDSFNSAYLYEINGTVLSDSTFVVERETEYRTNKTTLENTLFRFRETEQKPNVENYFKKYRKQFK